MNILKQAQKEIQEFFKSALDQAVIEAAKMQEFFTQVEAQHMAKAFYKTMLPTLQSKTPGAIECASFKQSAPDELAELHHKLRSELVTRLMQDYESVYVALEGAK